MKKILLVDDDYATFKDIVSMNLEDISEENGSNFVLIETGPVRTADQALQMIRNHPEANIVLLDGMFGWKEDCASVLPHLTREEIEKIICFSGSPEEWKNFLKGYGVKHFGGKRGYVRCLLKKCGCG